MHVNIDNFLYFHEQTKHFASVLVELILMGDNDKTKLCKSQDSRFELSQVLRLLLCENEIKI